MRYSELKQRECVSVETGERLGYISDLVVDEIRGEITGIVISEKKKIPLRKEETEKIIDLNMILTVGEDVLIIKTGKS